MSKRAFLKVRHGHCDARIIHSGGKKSQVLRSKYQARQEVISLQEKGKISTIDWQKLLVEIRTSILPEQTSSEARRAERSPQRVEQVLVFQ